MLFDRIIELITNFDEAYLTSAKSAWKRDKDYDLYKNPTNTEFRGLVKEGVGNGDFRSLKHFFIRFIIDTNTGDLYVWNGSHALHDDVLKLLKIKSRKGIVSGALESGQKYISYDPANNGVKDPDKIMAITREYLSPLVNLDPIKYQHSEEEGYRYNINGEYLTPRGN